MRRMRVLVIVNALFGYDGISSVATNYYKYQNPNVVKMDLLTINPVFDELSHILDSRGDKNYVLNFRNKKPIKYLFHLMNIIKKNKYDIVHVHGNSSTMALELAASKLAGCKCRIAHSHNTKCDHTIINKLLRPLFSHLYTDCCACSKEAGEFLFGNKKCYVVNNGLPLALYGFSNELREKIRNEIGVSDKYVIGHIGRFCYQKNQEFLIRLIKKIKEINNDAVLLLVGTGTDETLIRRQVVESGLEENVIFYGTTDKVYEIVQAMDVFVFPSRFEGLGIVAIEAQAAGLNCVASEAVPKAARIMNKTVFLPLEGNDEAWINAILKNGISSEKRQNDKDIIKIEMQNRGYDIDNNCIEMLRYYKEIIKRQRNAV